MENVKLKKSKPVNRYNKISRLDDLYSRKISRTISRG
jgi:hypothetical protein